MNVQKDLLNYHPMTSTRSMNAVLRARDREKYSQKSFSDPAVNSSAPTAREVVKSPMLWLGSSPDIPEMNFRGEDRFYALVGLRCYACHSNPFLNVEWLFEVPRYSLKCECGLGPAFSCSKDAIQHFRLSQSLSRP